MHRKTNGKLYTRFVPTGKRKCTKFKIRNTLKLPKFFFSKHVHEYKSINTQHLKNIISIINTVYELLKLYYINIWMIAVFSLSWAATVVPYFNVNVRSCRYPNGFMCPELGVWPRLWWLTWKYKVQKSSNWF